MILNEIIIIVFCATLPFVKSAVQSSTFGATLIGDSCKGASDCVGIPGETSTCNLASSSGSCECLAEYISSLANHTCLPLNDKLGMYCKEPQQCSVTNSSCIRSGVGSTCQCSSQYIQPPDSDSKCNLAAAKVGDGCGEHENQCSRLEGALCFTDDFTCRCDTSTHVTSNNGERCLRIADSLKEKCEETGQCSARVEHSECKLSDDDDTSRLECLCSEHYIESESRPGLACMKIIDELDNKCDENIQCRAGMPGNYSKCDGSPEEMTVCKCVYDAVHALNEHTCYMKVDRIHESCDIGEQCADIEGGSLCSDEGQCKCLDNFVPAQGLDKCLSMASLNDTCQESVQCETDNSECDLSGGGAEGVCLCKKDDFVESEDSPGSCVEIVKNLNEPCKENIQCSTGLGKEAECRENSGNLECQCKSEAITDGGNCYRKVETIGGSCEIDRQCLEGVGEYAECVDGTNGRECGCNAEAIPDSTKCLKIADHIGDGCSIHQQCEINLGELSQCNGTCCICEEASAVGNGDGTRCLNSGVLIGAPCEAANQCVGGPNSSCNNLVCECNSDFVNSTARDACLPLQPELNEECRESQQCTVADSTCAKDDDDDESLKCQCSSDFIAPPNGNKCSRLADEIGGSCEESANQCERVEDSTCVDDTCVCNAETQVPGAENEKCLDKIYRLNGTCEISPQCTVDHSSCLPSQLRENQCLCDVNYVESEVHPGTACVEIVHELYKPCSEDLQCSAIGGDEGMTGCREEKCACKSEAIPVRNECHKKATAVGDPCLVDYQCEANLGGWSQCFENQCICEDGATPAGGRCTRAGVHIGGHCMATEECVGEEPGTTSECINSKCVCRPGFIASAAKDNCLMICDDLGGTCKEPQQCTVAEAECSLNPDGNLTCKCSPGFIQPPDANATCNKLASKLGDSCVENDNQCDGVEGSTCDPNEKICTCENATQVPGADGSKCLPKLQCLYEACELSAQCQVGNSSCLPSPAPPGTDQQCLCDPGFIESLNNSGKSCLEIINELDKPCVETVQCSTLAGDDDDNGMASCLEGVCACTIEAIPHEGKCYRKASGIGDPCQFDTQCEVELGAWSYCSPEEICSCEDGASNQTEKCVRQGAHIDEECKASEDCVGKPGETSVCSETTSTCACLPGFISSILKDDCLTEYTDLGGECKEDQQCSVPDSSCIDKGDNSTCQCSPDFIKPPDANNKYNKLAQKIGESCEESDNQCDGVEGSTCDPVGKTCLCDDISQVPSEDEKRCLAKRDSLNMTCQQNTQCQVGNSSCNPSPIPPGDYLCLCNPGFVESLVYTGKACVKMTEKLGDPCTEPVQCSTLGGGDDNEMTTCFGGKCSCKVEAVPVQNKCYRKDVPIGSPCVVGEQCVGKPGENSECTEDSKCACTTGFIASSGLDDCLIFHTELDGACTQPQQCNISNSACITSQGGLGLSTCQCTPDFIKPPDATNKCNMLAEKIGETCSESDNQCDKLEGSFCHPLSKTCTCDPFTQLPGPDDKKCVDKRDSLDQECEMDAQCLVDNSECRLPSFGSGNSSCLCKSGFVESGLNPGKACVGIIREPNGLCDEGIQCIAGMGNFSDCRVQRCQCLRDYAFYQPDHTCYYAAGLGELCNSHEECLVGIGDYSRCSLNNPSSDQRCRCISGAIEFDGSCYGRKVVGDPCTKDAECRASIGGAVNCEVRSGRCVCESGHISVLQGTLCSGGVRLGPSFAVLLTLLNAVSRIIF